MIHVLGVFKSLKIDAFTVKNLQVTKIAASDSPQKKADTAAAAPVAFKKEDKPEVKKKPEPAAAATASPGKRQQPAAAAAAAPNKPAKAASKGSSSSESGSSTGSKGKAKSKENGSSSTSLAMTCPICDQSLQTSKAKMDINRYRCVKQEFKTNKK